MAAFDSTVGGASANAYVTVAAADTYFSEDRLFGTAWAGYTTEQKEAAIKWATRELDDRVDWIGDRVDDTQALEWPRAYAYVRGRLLASDAIPEQLQHAACEMALWLSASDRTAAPAGEDFDSLKLGPIELNYRDPTGSGGIIDAMPDTVMGRLSGLLRTQARGSGFYRVVR